LTGVFRNQRKFSFYFIQFLHSEVAWEAQSSILSVKLDMNIRGLHPRGLRPKKSEWPLVAIGYTLLPATTVAKHQLRMFYSNGRAVAPRLSHDLNLRRR